MKKLLFLVLILAVVLGLASCAYRSDRINYLQSQGYTVVFQIPDSSYRFLVVKDGKVGYAYSSADLLKRVPRLTSVIWIEGLKPAEVGK